MSPRHTKSQRITFAATYPTCVADARPSQCFTAELEWCMLLHFVGSSNEHLGKRHRFKRHSPGCSRALGSKCKKCKQRLPVAAHQVPGSAALRLVRCSKIVVSRRKRNRGGGGAPSKDAKEAAAVVNDRQAADLLVQQYLGGCREIGLRTHHQRFLCHHICHPATLAPALSATVYELRPRKMLKQVVCRHMRCQQQSAAQQAYPCCD